MDMTPTYWEENSNIQRVKYESCSSHDEASRLKDERGVYTCCDTNLNFSTATCSEDDCEYGPYKKNKVARQDPMSHRIIEKRRRDRMNNCLADLSRLIPTEYLKKGRGRIEKTEIIEMAIKHMKYLQQEHGNPSEHYRLGYQECMSEAMRFMVEVEGHFPREAVCVRLLNHLQKHCETISRAPSFTSNRHSSLGTEHIVPTPNTNEPVRNGTPVKVADYSVSKIEPETNNNGDSYIARSTNHPVESDYEKHTEINGMSYKYKTNIKLRFSQDVNGGLEASKRQKLENGRRNSLTSIENQSSSHSSPPSSEPCTRISDSENTHRRSPSDSALSMNNNLLKLEPPRNEMLPRYSSPNMKHLSTQSDLKHNFNIPIFVLHAKGSYYVPLTIDYKTLLPFLQNYDILEVMPTMHVLHPVTINVNFSPNFTNDVTSKYKNEYNNNWQ
ncbi:transcription factor cwo isoform X1 [Leptinotarsa decemlineata]|uniref:Clockwork orange n=2 Tax=Leptinotarsa decemlineata TaxID=7539 RepID=A0A0F7DCF7_LEPDE|nr:clockwork orange [Leptinotarsa decemlineata]